MHLITAQQKTFGFEKWKCSQQICDRNERRICVTTMQVHRLLGIEKLKTMERANNRLLETSESVVLWSIGQRVQRIARICLNGLKNIDEKCWGFLRVKYVQKIRNQKHFETSVGVSPTYKNTPVSLRTIRNTGWLVLAISRNDNFSNNGLTLRHTMAPLWIYR